MQKITKKLKKEWGFVPLAPGQRRVYQLINIGTDKETGRFRCPAQQNVVNQYSIRDYVSENSNEMVTKTISYITGQNPAPRDSDRDFDPVYGDLQFTKDQKGQIICSGDVPSSIDKDEFLFFHPCNENAKEQKGHIKLNVGYLYRLLEPAKSAQDKMAIKKMRRDMEELIEKMSEEDVSILCDMHLSHKTKHFGTQEKRAYLMDWVEKPANMNLVKLFSEDYKLSVRREIRKAVKMGLIKYSEDGTKVLWADTGQIIHHVAPKKKPEESLVIFFSTDDGEKLHEAIVISLAAATKGEPETA